MEQARVTTRTRTTTKAISNTTSKQPLVNESIEMPEKGLVAKKVDIIDDLINRGKFMEINENVDESNTCESPKIPEEFEDKENEDPKKNRPSACVFVASLCATKTDDDLCRSVTNHFKQYGELSSVKVLRDTSNRPYAFVQYTNDKDSSNAVKSGHNSLLDGRNLRCEAAKVNRTLFINFKHDLSRVQVEDILGEFGEIEQVLGANYLGKPTKRPENRHWFIKFVYRDDAIRAFANLTNDSNYTIEWTQNIESRVRNNGYTTNKETKTSDKPLFDKYSVFIGQLQDNTNEDELDQRFKTHGEIESISLFKKPGNNFAFIKFVSEKAAARAVELENHSMFNNKTIHVQYREFHNRSKMNGRDKGVTLAPAPITSIKKSSNFNARKNSNEGSFKANFKPNAFRPRLNLYSKFGAKNDFNKQNKISSSIKDNTNGNEYPATEYYYIPSEYDIEKPYFKKFNYNFYPNYQYPQFPYDYAPPRLSGSGSGSGAQSPYTQYTYPSSIYSGSNLNSINSVRTTNNKASTVDEKRFENKS